MYQLSDLGFFGVQIWAKFFVYENDPKSLKYYNKSKIIYIEYNKMLPESGKIWAKFSLYEWAKICLNCGDMGEFSHLRPIDKFP